jgi:menaquinone-dependent protoporphyrinogen oxidase
MRLLIGYASTDGQTRRIARFLADRAFGLGHSVEMLPLAEAEGLDLAGFDRAILAASIHASSYQPALAEFVEAHRGWLAAHPVLFVSVSLSAAGHDAEEWRGLARILDDFSEATGWRPDDVAQVAGAYRPSQYDLLNRFVMRRIIAEKDPEADPGADKEYTDWEALGATLDAWLVR